MTPILKGTAARLGLRKPTGVYRYRDGSAVYIDELKTFEWTMSPYWQSVFESAFRRR